MTTRRGYFVGEPVRLSGTGRRGLALGVDHSRVQIRFPTRSGWNPQWVPFELVEPGGPLRLVDVLRWPLDKRDRVSHNRSPSSGPGDQMDLMQEFEDRKRAIVSEIVRGHTELSLRDLLAYFEEEQEIHEHLMDTPVWELFGLAQPKPEPRRKVKKAKAKKKGAKKKAAKKAAKKATKKAPKRKAKKASAKSKATKSTAANGKPQSNGERTPAVFEGGTADVDAAVERFLREHPGAAAGAILEATGISRAQFRTSAKRLIGAQRLIRQGNSRAATYTLLQN